VRDLRALPWAVFIAPLQGCAWDALKRAMRLNIHNGPWALPWAIFMSRRWREGHPLATASGSVPNALPDGRATAPAARAEWAM